MKGKINKKTLLVIASILIIVAVGMVALNNTDRIAVLLAGVLFRSPSTV